MPRTSFGKTREADTPYATYVNDLRLGVEGFKDLQAFSCRNARPICEMVCSGHITHDA